MKGKHPPHPKITNCSQYPPKCRCESPQYATMCQCKLSQYGTGMSLSATCLDLKSIFCILRSQIPSNCQTPILFSIFKESLTHYIYLQLNVWGYSVTWSYSQFQKVLVNICVCIWPSGTPYSSNITVLAFVCPLISFALIPTAKGNHGTIGLV